MKIFKRILATMLALMLTTSITASAEPLIDKTKTCSITVHKYMVDNHIQKATYQYSGRELTADEIDSSAQPLAGIIFTATLLDENNAKTDVVKTFPETDEKGIATLTDLQQGKWYVEEVENTSAVASKSVPGSITVPFTNASGDGWVYDAHLYPKNADISITKDIQHLGNDHHTADIHEEHTWIVTSTLPDDLAEYTTTKPNGEVVTEKGYEKYSIVDEIDSRLEYYSTTKVCAVTDSSDDITIGTEYELAENVDYIFTKNDNTVKWSLTASGMKKISPYNGTRVQAEKMRIYFTTAIKESIADNDLGVAIPSVAKVEFTNSFGDEGERVSDTPEVHTTGIRIFKYDEVTGEALAGAKFKIATSEDNAQNGVFIQRNGEDYCITTDDNGNALFKGVAYGTSGSLFTLDKVTGTDNLTGETKYYLVETQAPVDENGNSYQLISSIIEVTANSNSHTVDYEVKIANTPPTVILTGGVGNMPYILSGAFIIGISVIGIAYFSRKRAKLTNNA